MALVKSTLKTSLYNGLYRIYINQSDKATSGDENEEPESVIRQISNDMADVIADAVDAYIKSGDITIGPTNVVAVAPNGPCTITSGQPAKIL